MVTLHSVSCLSPTDFIIIGSVIFLLAEISGFESLFGRLPDIVKCNNYGSDESERPVLLLLCRYIMQSLLTENFITISGNLYKDFVNEYRVMNIDFKGAISQIVRLFDERKQVICRKSLI